MTNPKLTPEEFEKLHGLQIGRLRKMVKNTTTVSEIRHAYERLKEMKPEMAIEFVFDVECLTAALVVAYGRLFSETHGTTKLSSNDIPKDLLSVHEELMKLRHAKYAHHGSHHFVDGAVVLLIEEKSVDMRMDMNLTICLGAPAHWEPLIEWLEKHVYELITTQLDYLTKTTGRKWFWAPQPISL
jgi:hypothetical protein